MHLNVSRAVVPVVKLADENEWVTELLGTGFFVGTIPILVTAAHVVRNNPLGSGEAYGCAFLQSDGKVKIGRFEDPELSGSYDIAAFSAKGLASAVPLTISKTEVDSNVDVLTFEFSQTRIAVTDDRLKVSFDPFTHKGNVLRHYNSNFPETTPTRCLDTSFPALQGASGAPVLRASDFAVVGMLVANHERHLLPAQILRIEGSDGPAEEVKYFLPTGKALAPSAIVGFLNEVGADPAVV